MYRMNSSLTEYLNKTSKQLLIWDFDLVIYKLDWVTTVPWDKYFERIYSLINNVDPTIIKDKQEFYQRKFPYPEIDKIGEIHGENALKTLKDSMYQREFAGLSKAIPNNIVIKFIQNSADKYQHAIWSNNFLPTIEYLLKQSELTENINFISTYDKVSFAKPNIEGFTLIENHFKHIPKSKMLMIGDSLRSDKAGAEIAGIDFFHFTESTKIF